MTGFPFSRFCLLTMIGTLVWNTILIIIGHFAGRAWDQILGMIDQWLMVILVVVVVIVACYLYYKFSRKTE